MMVIIDASMINEFVKDTEGFNKCTNERFKMLDGDGDGVITRNDLSKEGLGKRLLAMDDDSVNPDEDLKKAYDSIFEKFNVQGSNSIDVEKFQCIVKEIMLAVARGIGDTPVSMLLDEDSLFLKACVKSN